MVKRIKKKFSVHEITCECCNRTITCPECNRDDMLRSWSSNNKTLALCYYCGTVFYCDNDEVIARLTGDRDFWGSEAICLIDLPSNIINESVNYDYEDLILEIMEILENIYDITVYVIINSLTNDYNEFLAVDEYDDFINTLKGYLVKSNVVNIIIKTICENNIMEIRSILIENGEIFIIPAPELEYAYSHDRETGERISPPENYRFKDIYLSNKGGDEKKRGLKMNDNCDDWNEIFDEDFEDYIKDLRDDNNEAE